VNMGDCWSVRMTVRSDSLSAMLKQKSTSESFVKALCDRSTVSNMKLVRTLSASADKKSLPSPQFRITN